MKLFSNKVKRPHRYCQLCTCTELDTSKRVQPFSCSQLCSSSFGFYSLQCTSTHSIWNGTQI
ncbi:hypothetical protein BLOT_010026 [Blomia tropicalis]|nr:hypothetical protein BLOT_010026 [Blomia tropicalis]